MAVKVIDMSGPEDGPRLKLSATGSNGRRRWKVNIGDGVEPDGTVTGGGITAALQAVVAARGVDIDSPWDSTYNWVLVTDMEVLPLGGTNVAGGDGTGGWCMVEATYGSQPIGRFDVGPKDGDLWTEWVAGNQVVTVKREPTGTGYTYSVSPLTANPGGLAIANGEGIGIDAGTLLARVHVYKSLSTVINVPAVILAIKNTINANATVVPPMRGAPGSSAQTINAYNARMLNVSVNPISDTLRETVYEMQVATSIAELIPQWSPDLPNGQMSSTRYAVRGYKDAAWPVTDAGWIL